MIGSCGCWVGNVRDRPVYGHCSCVCNANAMDFLSGTIQLEESTARSRDGGTRPRAEEMVFNQA